MTAGRIKKLLVLSVGYGQGHHSAAAALAEHYGGLGWDTQVADVCEMASPGWFRLTQVFYQFCVRKAPWLWGITYALTDTADWRLLIRTPLLRRVVWRLRSLLDEVKPDFVFCTYPLFAYMLDYLREKGVAEVPYAMVVTDAMEISRPWMCSAAPLIIVPDDGSRRLVLDRYALPETRVVAAGFPVRSGFFLPEERLQPSEESLRVVYGAYRQNGGVIEDITALLQAFPQIHLTVIAGPREPYLKRVFGRCGNLHILRSTDRMPELLAQSHVYIGKAGAATMFECYTAGVPVLVNFLLPGQEEGNLRLLQADGAGVHVQSTPHLVQTLQELLQQDAAGWRSLCAAMKKAGRSGAVCRVANIVKEKFGI